MKAWMHWMRLAVIGVCALASGVGASDRDDHLQSAFGLRFALPEGWMALTPTQLESLRESTSSDTPLALPDALLSQLMAVVNAGQMAVYFNAPTNGTGFADNLAVYPTSDSVPEGRDAVRQTCHQLPELLTQQMKRRIQLSQCRSITVAGHAGLKLVYAGSVKRTQVIQVMTQRDEATSLLLTMTYHQDSDRNAKQALQQLLTSAEWVGESSPSQAP